MEDQYYILISADMYWIHVWKRTFLFNIYYYRYIYIFFKSAFILIKYEIKGVLKYTSLNFPKHKNLIVNVSQNIKAMWLLRDFLR